MRDKNKLHSSLSIDLLAKAESKRLAKEQESAQILNPEQGLELKKRGRPRKLEILKKKMRPGRPPKDNRTH